MSFTGLLIILVIAFVVSVIASYGFKSYGPWGSFWIFFLILFLAGMSGSFWIDPTGPRFQGTAWVPITFVVVLFAILLIAATPAGARRKKTANVEAPIQAPGPVAEGQVSHVVLGIFFWALLLLLAFSVLFGVLSRNTAPPEVPPHTEPMG